MKKFFFRLEFRTIVNERKWRIIGTINDNYIADETVSSFQNNAVLRTLSGFRKAVKTLRVLRQTSNIEIVRFDLSCTEKKNRKIFLLGSFFQHGHLLGKFEQIFSILFGSLCNIKKAADTTDAILFDHALATFTI